jgi:hypothetical protein
MDALKLTGFPRRVTLRNPNGGKFRGLLLKTNVGSFTGLPLDGAAYKDCSGVGGESSSSPGGTGLNQAVSHTNVDAKESVTVTWVPPAGTEPGTIVRPVFVAAVLIDAEIWYPVSVEQTQQFHRFLCATQ